MITKPGQQNFWLYEATMERDPSGILAWLVGELEAAETAGERVWLMGKSMSLFESQLIKEQVTCRWALRVLSMMHHNTSIK